ncbi:MAG: hypothetical protein MMC33_004551 [Icmadophila ericetorum]|nr:hypothetical protein [Icmadophila ericetorum]
MWIPVISPLWSFISTAIPTQWRIKKVFLYLACAELPFIVAALALYGIADPDTYRTSLWQEGANHGWNSDPIEILYAYANYLPIKVPTPWNQFITSFNVVFAVLSMFILLVKVFLYIMDLFWPLLALLVHALLIVLASVSIYNQAGSDYSDSAHPSRVPWYLTKGCGPPVATNLHGYCLQAQGSFAVASCLLGLYTLYFCLAFMSCIPTKSHPAPRNDQSSKQSDLESPGSSFTEEKWEMEMNRLPRTPGTSGGMKSPMTPRTMAFKTLDGSMSPGRRPNKDLPLRHHIAMGEETWASSKKR